MSNPTRQQYGENPQKRPTISSPHPDYLTWGGYPHGDRCVRPVLATDHRTASTHRHGGTGMIPADHITFNDDPAGEPASTGTAWLIVAADPDQYGWAAALDRPCDTCGGETAERHGEDHLTHPCSDCINGRHTFTIDVEADTDWDVIYNAPPTTRTYQVSVVPGMVLPIYADTNTGGLMEIVRYARWIDANGHIWQDGAFVATITLPSDAKPGMFAVQLRVTA